MRLVTRGDLDGLTCAVLITSCEEVEEIDLVHPQDITQKRIHIGEDDILANLPYAEGCGKWFDHHQLTQVGDKPPDRFEGRYGLSPSAARVVFEYYMCANPDIKRHMRLLAETDRFDSAHLDLEDVLDPRDYVMLGFTLDPRTGLRGYREYFFLLLEALKTKSIEEILALPEVKERVLVMRAADEQFRQLTKDRSRLDGNVVVTDFRGLSPQPVGNRFIVYTLFPQANISVRVHPGPTSEQVAVAVGRSIFNRTSRTNVGQLMAGFGGGGHRGAGTCLLLATTADDEIEFMVEQMKKDG
ncbi:MAG: exopolyphosphatase [Vicinamibacteria bacterium]|nr:exopolyphosphatase [Vicinamibacteria bacterium]